MTIRVCGVRSLLLGLLSLVVLLLLLVAPMAEAASISATPGLVTPGGAVTITGRAFPHGARGAAALSGAPTVGFRVDRDGRAGAVLHMRRSARPGSHRLVVRAGDRRVSTVLTVVGSSRPSSILTALSAGQRLLVMPAQGDAGATFRVTARGFARRRPVRIRLATVSLATRRSNVRGAVAMTARIPPIAAGAHRLRVASGATRMGVRFVVTSETTTSPQSVPPALGPSLYVSPTGSDGASCTSTAPCRTLGRANALASPGVTVRVAPGSYSGATLSTAGTSTARVRYVSASRWGATLTSSVRVNGQYVDVEGFDARAPIALNASFSRAIGNHVHDLGVSCGGESGIAASSLGAEIIGNLVNDIATGPRDGTCRLTHGIYAAAPEVKIVNNVIVRSLGDGVTSWHAATRLTVANNTSVFNGGNGILIGSGDSGATSSGHTGSLVSNNVTYGNAIGGINEGDDGVHPVGPNTYLQNLMFANTHDGVAPRRGGSVSGSVIANPLFVDASRDDYRLQAASPAVDAGTGTGAPSNDFDGVARPQGAAKDIGAHER